MNLRKKISRKWKTFWDLLRKTPLKDFLHFSRLRLYAKVRPYTMVGPPRLSNVFHLAQKVDQMKLPGALVECGVWKGGCSAVMATASHPSRPLWLFDSFEGLPEPTAEDGKDADEYSGHASEGNLKTIGRCVGPLETVKKLFFEEMKIPRERVHLVQGWFQDTLPVKKEELGSIALLRLDGDWYESTKVCLENLYDQVVPGGFIILDDYHWWEGCKKATDEFLEKRGISATLHTIDDAGAYFQKPFSAS